MGKLLCILIICGLILWPVWGSVYQQVGPVCPPPYHNGDLVPSPVDGRLCKIQGVHWSYAENVTIDKATGLRKGGRWKYRLVPVE